PRWRATTRVRRALRAYLGFLPGVVRRSLSRAIYQRSATSPGEAGHAAAALGRSRGSGFFDSIGLDITLTRRPTQRSATAVRRRALRLRRRLHAFDGAGVVVDDLPAIGESLPNQRENAADIALGLALEMPVAEDKGGIPSKKPELEIGKSQFSHGGAVGIAPVIALADTRKPARGAAAA